MATRCYAVHHGANPVPKLKLSDLGLQSLTPPAKGHLDYWDAALPTFGVRLSPRGTKTFILKQDNSRRAIGRYPLISLSQARTEAKRLLAERTLGKVRPQSITFVQAKELYLEEKRRSRKPRTALEYQRLLARLPFKGQLSEITHHEFSRRLQKFTSPAERDHLVVAAKVFFNWCIKRRYITENPATGLSIRPAVSRSRVLSDEELQSIWHACSLEPAAPEDEATSPEREGPTKLPRAFATIVKLLILTGQRRGEIAALHARYYSHNRQTICLPGEITKNGREHTFPTGSLTKFLLKDLLSNNALLFPARGSNASKPFNGWSKSKAALDKLSGVRDWTLHDLRRTFRTNLARLKVQPYIAERLVNHVSARSDMEEVYDLWTYMPEMRDAMEKWEAHLRKLLGGTLGQIQPHPSHP